MLLKILLPLGILPILLSGATRPAPVVEPVKGFALVELYTSEGCSSCPPAEELAATLPKSYPSGVYLLSFHVDYWDRLGWKDPFSNAEYTRRQKEYNTALVPMLNSIFTPQVIVNGKKELGGTDEPRIREAIDNELANTVNPAIDASAHCADNKTVTVDYTLVNKKGGEFKAALVQVRASTAVKNGENAGRQLNHAYVVRDLKASGKSSGTLKLSLPTGLTPGDCKVVIFLQDKENMHIAAAHMLDIQ